MSKSQDKILQEHDIREGDTPKPHAGVSRRSFIEMIGYSAAVLALNGCRAPEQKIIPYLRQPVELTPGVANWYASTCGGCGASCGTLVKVRDGRPIKLEGNQEHPLSKGGLCALAHGLVFSLYDSDRLRHPLIKADAATWDDIDQQINKNFAAVRQSHGKLRLLTPLISSPTSRKVIATFLQHFPDARHISYQPVSSSAIHEAHAQTHRRSAVPAYRIENARLVVSFSADFLGTWMAPVQFTRSYSQARNLQSGREMLRHIQFESHMSLTGSNADRRVAVSPDEEIEALLLVAKRVATMAGSVDRVPAELASFEPTRLSPEIRSIVDILFEELRIRQGKSLVLSGSNSVSAQIVINFINQALHNYGHTLDLANGSDRSQVSDRAIVDLVEEMNTGQVAALVISGVNPAYDYFAREEFIRGLNKVPLKISLSSILDETASLADYVCPQPHFLESWNDAEPEPGLFSLTQPAIAPLFNTRPYQESLLRWSEDGRSFYDVLRKHWQEKLFPQQPGGSFDEFWDQSLHDGIVRLATPPSTTPEFTSASLNDAVKQLKEESNATAGKLTVALFESVVLRDGTHANNPWLQELPDPLSKVTWDNTANISPDLARQLQLEEGSLIRVSKSAVSVELPVHIQIGQHPECVSIALGYGRTRAGKVGNHIGANAYPLVSFARGTFQYLVSGIVLEKTGGKVELARTQLQDTLGERPIVRELTLASYLEGKPKESEAHRGERKDLWPGYEYTEHKWGMVVDLNACVGCSACLLSCQAENNVPVVGKEEVLRRREMHWIRLDRYYKFTDDDPTVAFQPVMCQQCDNASCESVCPVLATVHSSEGLNMQVYNRCVGTRYCENNCAYKVRRFNWFEYPHEDALANLALNPDVTVRSRGVMEKCTFCVQRIEAAKIRARNEGRAIRDGEIQTACQQSCPAGAIAFGNLIDLKSRAAQLKHDERNYVLLEELNLRPPLSYMAKVRNAENLA